MSASPPRQRRGGLVALLLVGLVTASAGAVAGAVAVRTASPRALLEPEPPRTFPVVVAPFDDARQVELELEVLEGTPLVAQRGGVVTATACRPGAELVSGAVAWRIDATGVVALATATPLYRDLPAGARGPDVAALQAELTRLGFDAGSDGVLGPRTARAYRAMRVGAGLDPATSLSLADVLWIPSARTRIAECSAGLGATATPGEPLARAAPTTASVAVSQVPADLAPGERVLVVGDQALPVSPTGAVDDPEAVRQLLATPEGQLAQSTAGGEAPYVLSGSLVLAEPLETASVPTSAVATSPTTCVRASSGEPVPVEVVGSSLGRSVVVFPAGDPPDEVLVRGGDGAPCG